jgi:hypothetical protein
LEEEKAHLLEVRLRLNGEMELGRRQIQDDRYELQEARRQWQEQKHEEECALRRRARELDRRAASLAEAEQLLAEQRQFAEDRRLDLEREVEGLENRARNLRRKLQEQSPPSAVPGPGFPESSAAAVSPPSPPAEALGTAAVSGTARSDEAVTVARLADVLQDQRAHLLEQWEHLERVRLHWEEEHAAALGEIEAAGARLQERERQLGPREQALQSAEEDLRHRQEEIARRRADFEARHARLAVREAGWETERQGLLAQLHQREQLVERRLRVMAQLRQAWIERGREELARLHGELQRCEEVRRQYSALWEECFQRQAALDRAQRALAERTLALAEYQTELIARSGNAAAAEKRLGRLRRRLTTLDARAERRLTRDHQELAAEASRLDEIARHVREQLDSLCQREGDLLRAQAEWNQACAAEEEARARSEAERQTMLLVRDQKERELQVLREEVERLGGLLLEEGPTILRIGQAA